MGKTETPKHKHTYQYPLTPEEADARRRATRKRKLQETRARKREVVDRSGFPEKLIALRKNTHALRKHPGNAKWVPILEGLDKEVQRVEGMRNVDQYTRVLTETKETLEGVLQLIDESWTPAKLAAYINNTPVKKDNKEERVERVRDLLPTSIPASGHHWALWVREDIKNNTIKDYNRTHGRGRKLALFEVTQTDEWRARKQRLLASIELEL
jgi:hypothetical protein